MDMGMVMVIAITGVVINMAGGHGKNGRPRF
jgi:hypothetical protein